MILAIDIGNTNMVVGLFDDFSLLRKKSFRTDCLVDSDTVSKALMGFRSDRVDKAIISSVVPGLTRVVAASVQHTYAITPFKVTRRMNTGLRIKIDKPAELGADRIVNAAYGFHVYGGPLLLIDFGTATTLCAVTARAEYIGGAIMPGIELAADALVRKAARLNRVSLKGPLPVIGKNTADSMRLGIIEGHAGAVLHVAERILISLGSKNASVVATGGLAGIMAERIPIIDTVDPDLTLKGLCYLAQKYD